MGIPLIPKLFWLLNRILFSMDIDHRANIGSDVMFIHGIGLTIGKSSVIEDGVKLYQGVTIGGTGKVRMRKDKTKFSQPIIKKNSVIYTNSCVLGPVVVGENSKIGACSIVLHDVPENTTYITHNTN